MASSLPPVPGMNVVTRPDGTQVYSRYTQADLDQRNGPLIAPKPQAVENPDATVPYSTNDQFASNRAEAIKSGSFDYGAVKSASYSPPSTYVDKSGNTVIRNSGPTNSQSQVEHDQQQQQASERLAEDKAYNESLLSLRQNAPSSIKSGSEEDMKVRQLSNSIENDLYTTGGYKQKASSSDLSTTSDHPLVSNKPVSTDERYPLMADTLAKPAQATKPLSGLTDINAVKESQAVYQYEKTPTKESNPPDLVGLVNNRIDLSNEKINQENQLIEQSNKNGEINFGIDKLVNQDIEQKNQLIEQSNKNNLIDYAISKLTFESDLIKSAKASGANSIDVLQGAFILGSPISSKSPSPPEPPKVLESVPIDLANTLLPGLLTKYQNKENISFGFTPAPVNKTANEKQKMDLLSNASLTTRQKLEISQGVLNPTSGGEAVSFLRFPYSPNKGASSNGIQSTNILEPLQFLPGLGSGLLAKGTEMLSKVLFKESPDIVTAASKTASILSKANAEKYTGTFVKQYPTYRNTNPMRTPLPSNIFEKDIAEEPKGSARPNQPISHPLLENVSKETTASFSKAQDDLLKPVEAKPTLKGTNQPVKEVPEYKPNLNEFRTKGGKINVDDVLGTNEKPAIGNERFNNDIEKLKNNINKKEQSMPSTPNEKPSSSTGGKPAFTSTNINLGTGIGKLIPKEGGGEINDLTRPKPPEEPSTKPKPSEKEVSAGKGLVQLVKQEKPELLTKTKQTQKSLFKEYPIQLGKGKGEQIIKPKPQTKAEQLNQKYLQDLQQKRKQNQDQSLQSFQVHDQTLQSFTLSEKQKQAQPQMSKQSQRQKSVLIFKQVQKQEQPQTQRQVQNQGQSQLFKQTQKQPQMFKQTQSQPQMSKQTQKQGQSQIFKQTNPTPQITKQKEPPKPPVLIFESPKNNPKKHKHISAKKLNFLGNASVSDIVGLTRRADITYGNKLTAKLTRKDIAKSARGTFVTNSISKPQRKESKPFNLYQKNSSNKRTYIKPYNPKSPLHVSQSKKLRL